jgi:hypothetical protein
MLIISLDRQTATGGDGASNHCSKNTGSASKAYDIKSRHDDYVARCSVPARKRKVEGLLPCGGVVKDSNKLPFRVSLEVRGAAGVCAADSQNVHSLFWPFDLDSKLGGGCQLNDSKINMRSLGLSEHIT